MSKNHYHAREAAAALLKMAKSTSDPAIAAGLIEAAASLKEQAGELPPPAPLGPPALLEQRQRDLIQTGRHRPEAIALLDQFEQTQAMLEADLARPLKEREGKARLG